MNIKTYFGLLIFLFLSSSILADDIKVVSFKKDINCLDARIAKNVRTDYNDNPCAIIKVRTNMKDLEFSAYPAIIGDIQYIEGEYWVYVSQGTRELSFFGPNITRYDYIIDETINSYDVFILELKTVVKNTDVLLDKLGSLFVLTSPPLAHISINNEPTGFYTPFQYTPIEGKYYLNIYLPGYETFDTLVNVSANQIVYINKDLKKLLNAKKNGSTNKLSIDLNNDELIKPRLFIDGKLYNEKIDNPIDVSKGKHNVTLFSVCFKPIDTIINIKNDFALKLSPQNICGKITVVEQNDANIYLDKQSVGKGNITSSLFEGYHLIEAEKEGFGKYQKVIYIEKNKRKNIEIKIKEKKASITFNTIPSGANIWVDGSLVGKTPKLLKQIEKGKHEIILELNGFGIYAQSLNVEYSQNYLINKSFEIGRRININTFPEKSDVFYEGIFMGKSPMNIYLPFTNVILKFRNNNYPNLIDTINVSSCSDTINVNLAYKAKGPEMIFVSGGCFNRHFGWTDFKVCVDDFYISKYEVSNLEYCYFLNDQLRDTAKRKKLLKVRTIGHHISYNEQNKKFEVEPGYERYPVNYVSWYNAEEYCEWQGGRLPTEAEWQFVVEGGHDSDFKYGDTDAKIEEIAWYNKNSNKEVHECGSLKPNTLNCYDLVGNLNEWCYDWYSTDYFVNCPDVNPQGPNKGFYKSVRGGSFNDKKKECEIDYRRSADPNKKREDIGFRLVKLDFN